MFKPVVAVAKPLNKTDDHFVSILVFNAEEGQEEVGCAQRKSRSEGVIRRWRLLMKTDSIKANQEGGQK
jgi:hypothetical protein